MTGQTDGRGNTAYHPRMTVALIMYCYRKRIRSSPVIKMATFDDVLWPAPADPTTVVSR